MQCDVADARLPNKLARLPNKGSCPILAVLVCVSSGPPIEYMRHTLAIRASHLYYIVPGTPGPSWQLPDHYADSVP